MKHVDKPFYLLVGAALITLGLVDWQIIRAAAAPLPTYMCTSAKTGDPAPACAAKVSCGIPKLATDEVRVAIGNQQTWEPYATITASTGVANCANGQWTTMAALGIPLFSSTASIPPPAAPPPTTPPVTPPPAVPTQSITVCAVDNSAACAVFPGLSVPECFNLTGATSTVQACAK